MPRTSAGRLDQDRFGERSRTAAHIQPTAAGRSLQPVEELGRDQAAPAAHVRLVPVAVVPGSKAMACISPPFRGASSRPFLDHHVCRVCGPIGHPATVRAVNEWAVLLHVGEAFWFVAGLVGRDVTLAKAAQATDITVTVELAELAGQFDRWMVIPGSMAVLALGIVTVLVQGRPFAGTNSWWILTALLLFSSMLPLVPLVFLPRGRIFERALSDARERGEVTAELNAAFHDPRSARPACTNGSWSRRSSSSW